MNDLHVLVADDERPVAYLLRRSLESIGARVTVVPDGLQALEAGRTLDVDLALLDQLMPGLLGVEVLQRWRAEGIDIPVIMVSGLTNEDEVVKALELGASDYVRKPFSVRELLARVEVVLRDRGRIAAADRGGRRIVP